MTNAELDKLVDELEAEDAVFVPNALAQEIRASWVDECYGDWFATPGHSDFKDQVLKLRLLTGMGQCQAINHVKSTYILIERLKHHH